MTAITDTHPEQRVAIVTGGARGIGAAITTALARTGVHVAAGYSSNSKAADELKGKLEAEGASISVHRGNVGSPEDCQRVRLALEQRLPFGPGFRRLEVEFPKNDNNIEGHVCRLLTMGTGAHMEGYGIHSLKDMRSKVMQALKGRVWRKPLKPHCFRRNPSTGARPSRCIRTMRSASPPSSSAWSMAPLRRQRPSRTAR